MSSMYEYLSEQIRQRRLATPTDLAGFVQGERERYWQHLLGMNLGETDRLNALREFDAACQRLVGETQAPSPPAPSPVPPRPAPAGRTRSVGRDVFLVLIGALLAVPATLAANYLTNLWLPSSTKVDVQAVGVQQLKSHESSFIFMRSTLAASKRDGAIDVIYAMGTDAARYTCRVNVSIPQLFEHMGFEQGCRRIRYRFVDPQRIFARPGDFGTAHGVTGPAIIFNVEITADNGQKWIGSESLNWAVMNL